jgi:hypothetical protein
MFLLYHRMPLLVTVLLELPPLGRKFVAAMVQGGEFP